ncbi:hypothetical protein N9O61_00570 [Octadecabacter sp.]|nr:hypothetical protein [Octadecabacter sp.]
MRSTVPYQAMAIAFACAATTANAQSIDGLYQPAGSSWSCSPEQVGVDGGVLAIRNGVFDGVENRCELTAPVPSEGGTRFTAVCSAEGSTYSEPMTITPTDDGVQIDRNGLTANWSLCDGQQATTSTPRHSNSRWVVGFGQGVSESSTRDGNGNSVTFTCNGGEDGGLYVELGGQPIAGGQVEFDIDGHAFGMTAWTEGGRINTECTVCGMNYIALWEAASAGSLMTVRASDGLSTAFSLNGSRDALGNVVCQPEDGY